MKKLFGSLLLFLLAFTVNAQKINTEKIDFDYVRLPLNPLAEAVQDIDREVVIEYEDEVLAAIADYEAMVEQMKEDEAKAKEEWKSKSLGQKFVSKTFLDEGKPQAAYIPPAGYFPEIHDPKSLEGYIKVDGFGTAVGAPVKITAYLKGFEIGEVSEGAGKKKVKRGDSYIEEPYFFRTVKFRHPIRVRVEHEGIVLFDEMIEGLNNFSARATSNYKSKSALEKYWRENEKNFLRDCDVSCINSNMKTIQNILNDYHGYTTLNYKTEVYRVKSGKMKYPRFDQAFEAAANAYLDVVDHEVFEDVKAGLQEAVDLWEAEIKEHEPDNKKARIADKHVAVARLNCAEALCWMHEFSKARRHINKIKLMNIKKYEKKAKALEDMISDHKTRFDANFGE